MWAGSIPLPINYDPPPHDLTRGQVSRTYCYDSGQPVAFLRRPLSSGVRYSSDAASVVTEFCPDPYDISPDAFAPSSPTIAHTHWQDAYSKSQRLGSSRISVPTITASKWRVSRDGFSIEADLSSILDTYGPGVYTVSLWGGHAMCLKLFPSTPSSTRFPHRLATTSTTHGWDLLPPM